MNFINSIYAILINLIYAILSSRKLKIYQIEKCFNFKMMLWNSNYKSEYIPQLTFVMKFLINCAFEFLSSEYFEFELITMDKITMSKITLNKIVLNKITLN